MILDNKLNITNQIELSKVEEKISKQKAKQLFDSGDINKVQVGTDCLNNVLSFQTVVGHFLLSMLRFSDSWVMV